VAGARSIASGFVRLKVPCSAPVATQVGLSLKPSTVGVPIFIELPVCVISDAVAN